MAYRFYNPNPDGKFVGDCVIRAITKVEESDWDSIYIAVVVKGLMHHDMPSSNDIWGKYLKSKGYTRHLIPDSCPDCYTIAQFAYDNPLGRFAVATGSHVVAVVDGDYYDAWDSGNEVPIYYWAKEK